MMTVPATQISKISINWDQLIMVFHQPPMTGLWGQGPEDEDGLFPES